jgi:acyl-coenzyme A thioesterase PaaI-like protein
MTSVYLQDQLIPEVRCFGCGPANPEGLQLKTIQDGEYIVGEWSPKPHHESILGILSSGIIASLLDCSANWACVMGVVNERKLTGLPTMVTKEFTVRLHAPVYMKSACTIRSKVIEHDGRRITGLSELLQDGKVCASCTLMSVVLDEEFDPANPGERRP